MAIALAGVAGIVHTHAAVSKRRLGRRSIAARQLLIEGKAEDQLISAELRHNYFGFFYFSHRELH